MDRHTGRRTKYMARRDVNCNLFMVARTRSDRPASWFAWTGRCVLVANRYRSPSGRPGLVGDYICLRSHIRREIRHPDQIIYNRHSVHSRFAFCPSECSDPIGPHCSLIAIPPNVASDNVRRHVCDSQWHVCHTFQMRRFASQLLFALSFLCADPKRVCCLANRQFVFARRERILIILVQLVVVAPGCGL